MTQRASTTVDFRILGRLEVLVQDQQVTVVAGRQRVLLASLLLRANEIVPVDDLVDRLWGTNPPRSPRPTVQTYVQRLRQTLGTPERVVTSRTGYQVLVGPDELDLARFREHVARASTTSDLAERSGLLQGALEQWRGRPLVDVPSESVQSQDVPHLEAERLEVLERSFDVELRLGRHAELIRQLQAVSEEHPLRERFSGQLMLALYRSGRQAEAFAVFHKVARALAEQLGVDPGEELRTLHQAILTGDPSVAAPQPVEVVAAAGAHHHASPRQLPPDLRDFVGRDELIGQIASILEPDATAGVPLVVITGPPGAGKTALAVRVAHELAAKFPDGQLYADLRGYSVTPALTPQQVISRFLVSLGVPGLAVPSDLDEVTTLYRTLLANRRVLVLLDNAAVPTQVRPLLPSAPGCAVLVTSRNELRGLTALQGSRPVNLDVLPPAQSYAVLAAIVGADRVGAEPDATADIAAQCGHLPLALRIAAANLLARPRSSVGEFAEELRQGNLLARLAIDGDDEAAVRGAFELSYTTLSAPVARLFRLLGLVPGSAFDVDAVAALGDVPVEQAARLLDQLTAANLVGRSASTRFHLHDLLRLYAVERCRLEEDEVSIAQATDRLYRFYLVRVDAAARLLYPVWLTLLRPERTGPGARFTHSSRALAWMDQEFLNITAAITHACVTGPTQLAWAMAELLRPYLVTQGRYRAEGLSACHAVLDAATEAGNHRAVAAMNNTLGAVYNRHAEYPRAMRHYREELRAHRADGFAVGQARALVAIGNISQAMGDLDEGARHIRDGLRLAEENGSRSVSCLAWMNLGFVELQRGNLDAAEHAARQAVPLCDDEGGRIAEGECRAILGELLLRRGRCTEAIAEFGKARFLYLRNAVRHYEADVLGLLALAHRELGDYPAGCRYAEAAASMANRSSAHDEEADALAILGSIYLRLGHDARALTTFDTALALARRIGHVRAEIVALHGFAEHSRKSGDPGAAVAHARTALERSRSAGFQTLEGQTETLLGWIRFDLREFAVAAEHAWRAAEIHQRTGGRLDHARALHVLGLAHRARDDAGAARRAWRQALTSLPETGTTPEIAEYRRLLSSVDPAH
ncbi:AfsR/SARP family transcriptional regulator [Actinophytocola xinjiangensis]|uniref:AfsR/SARP family transcriptional regulator n=1 Tax=Actinophytocola xinjiangensis TaxID=485602 RepID=UPI000A00C1AC|nr:BTAD domain-containing putative transcriptional regulator [Actinophytocola xinjiangensis]